MYNPKYTESFYDAYGELEWSRLETRAYGRLQAVIHNDFLKRYIKAGNRVLDAGSGPGRFSITIAQLGARVTVLDISGGQLKLAKEKIYKENLLDKIENFVKADISDLSMFPDESFDAVVCFGGALSYVLENRVKAAEELKRVTRSGGIILVSVMGRLGSILSAVGALPLSVLKKPYETTNDTPGLWQILESGNLPGFPSRRAEMIHALMHLYTADELQHLFAECQLLEMAGSNVITPEFLPALDEMAKDEEAWATIIEFERKLNSSPGLVDSGTHIIMAVRK